MSIHQPVREIEAFFYTSKTQLKQWRSVIVARTRFGLLLGGKNLEVRKMLPSPSLLLRILIRLLIYLFLELLKVTAKQKVIWPLCINKLEIFKLPAHFSEHERACAWQSVHRCECIHARSQTCHMPTLATRFSQ